MIDRGIPRHGYKLVNAEGEEIGEVTSGTMSPTRKIGIGMAYVAKAYTALDTEIFIDVRGRKLKVKVVKLVPSMRVNRTGRFSALYSTCHTPVPVFNKV